MVIPSAPLRPRVSSREAARGAMIGAYSIREKQVPGFAARQAQIVAVPDNDRAAKSPCLWLYLQYLGRSASPNMQAAAGLDR
jgi:hypothetical protein